jgi:MATE family multidrug resistance protein
MTTARVRARPLRPPARTLSEHVTRTLALALPVMFGRAGLLIAITVALVVVGHAGPNDQAYFAAGFALHMLVLVFGMGLVASVTVLSAQANGAGNAQQCGRIWRLGLLLAAACGTGAAVLLLWGRAILQLAGQSDDIVFHGGEVIWAFAPGMPAILMFIATWLVPRERRQTAAGHDRLPRRQPPESRTVLDLRVRKIRTAGHGRFGRGARPHCHPLVHAGRNHRLYAGAAGARLLWRTRAARRPLPHRQHAAEKKPIPNPPPPVLLDGLGCPVVGMAAGAREARLTITVADGPSAQ